VSQDQAERGVRILIRWAVASLWVYLQLHYHYQYTISGYSINIWYVSSIVPAQLPVITPTWKRLVYLLTIEDQVDLMLKE